MTLKPSHIRKIINKIDISEIKELILASLILSFIISYSSYKDVFSLNFYKRYLLILLLFSLSFILHEISHKFAAILQGKYARFHISYSGLAFSFILKVVTGVTLIIPGAVIVYHHFLHKIRKKDVAIEGVIAIAGPLSNFVLSIISLILVYLFNHYIFFLMLQINALLLFFNLLPIPPLDGFKIARWSIWIYLPFFFISILLFLFV